MEDDKQKQIKDNLSRIKHRILVLSGKGGVGKSFIAVNIAYGLALQGKKVGIIDIDIHGPSIAKLTKTEGKRVSTHPVNGMPVPVKVHSNLMVLSVAFFLSSDKDALIWRGPLKNALIKQFFSDFYWDEIDYLIVDCPPGTGDESLSIIQTLENVDGAVIVTTPQDIAVLDVKKSVNFIQKTGINILGIIENMKFFCCPKCEEVTKIFNGNQLEQLVNEHCLDILAELEIDPKISSSADEGKPYVYFHNNQPSAKELMNAVSTIIRKVEK